MTSQSAVQIFIASARRLHAKEKDAAKRWEKMTPLLQELLADPSVKEQSRNGRIVPRVVSAPRTYCSMRIRITGSLSTV